SLLNWLGEMSTWSRRQNSSNLLTTNTRHSVNKAFVRTHSSQYLFGIRRFQKAAMIFNGPGELKTKKTSAADRHSGSTASLSSCSVEEAATYARASSVLAVVASRRKAMNSLSSSAHPVLGFKLVSRRSSTTPFLCSGHSFLAHQHRAWSRCSGGVFTL